MPIHSSERRRGFLALAMLLCSLTAQAEHGVKGRADTGKDNDPTTLRAFAQRVQDLEKSLGATSNPEATIERRIESLEVVMHGKPSRVLGLKERTRELLALFPLKVDVDKVGLVFAATEIEKLLWGTSHPEAGIVARLDNIERTMQEKQSGLGLRARIDAIERLLVRVADLEDKLELKPDTSRSFETRLQALEKRKNIVPGATDSFQVRLTRLENSP